MLTRRRDKIEGRRGDSCSIPGSGLKERVKTFSVLVF